MARFTWSQLFGNAGGTMSKTARRIRPALFTLEDRYAPAVFTVDIVGAPTDSPEGELVELASTLTPPPAAPTYTWSVTKDGSSFSSGGSDVSFSFTPDNPGSYVVTLEASDGVDTFSDSVTITVTDVVPVPIIVGAPTTSPEGTAIDLASSVTGASVDTFTYSWTVTKDGSAFASGTEADFGFTPDDNASYEVTLEVTDDDGSTGTVSAIVDVTNVAPTASVTGPTSGVRGQALTYTLSAVDPSSADAAAGFTYDIDWNGDGTVDETVSGGASVDVIHTFADEGTNVVTVTATDKDGGASDAATLTTEVDVFAIQPDAADPTKTSLVVGGTAEADHVHVKRDANTAAIIVILNGEVLGSFTPTGSVVVFGQAGDDLIHLNGNVPLSARLYGDEGNDRLKGGRAGDLLVGGEGDDHLGGKKGNDILIGGEGADRLVAQKGADILIGDSTSFDSDDAALGGLLLEWNSGTELATRRANLLGEGDGTGLNGENVLSFGGADGTITDDGVADILTGAAGIDWFFGDPDVDHFTDFHKWEYLNDLEPTGGKPGGGNGKK